MTPKEQAILAAYNATPALQTAGGAGKNNVDIAAAINALPEFDGETLTIANPVAQATVPKPLTIEALLALVPADKVAGFLATQFQDFAKAFLESSAAAENKAQMIAVLGAMASNSQKSDLIQAVKYLVDADSRPALKAFLNVLEADGKITTATNTATAAEIDATIDQPGYQATIANPARQFVSPEEVQTALN